MDMRDAIADFIKAELDRRGWSSPEYAKKPGGPLLRTVQKFLKDPTQVNYSAVTLDRLVKGLGMEPMAFLAEVVAANPKIIPLFDLVSWELGKVGHLELNTQGVSSVGDEKGFWHEREAPQKPKALEHFLVRLSKDTPVLNIPIPHGWASSWHKMAIDAAPIQGEVERRLLKDETEGWIMLPAEDQVDFYTYDPNIKRTTDNYYRCVGAMAPIMYKVGE